MQILITDSGVSAVLQGISAALANMQPVFQAIGSRLEQNVQLRFDTKSDPAGVPWAAWAPSTAKARATEGRGTLLEYTGRMRTSLTYLADHDSAEVGFGVDYAKNHEFGTRYMPARPMLFDRGRLSQDDTDTVIKAAMAALQRQLTP